MFSSFSPFFSAGKAAAEVTRANNAINVNFMVVFIFVTIIPPEKFGHQSPPAEEKGKTVYAYASLLLFSPADTDWDWQVR